jgi:hypothetical protein
MNEDNIAALESILGQDDSCWLATLPVPYSYGESNLFAREPVLFRKKKRVAEDEGRVAENEGGYSRQQSRGILIPTASRAVVEEWTNVKKQVQLWGWAVSETVSALLFA